MTARDVIRESAESLRAHRLRAALSALGVLTGVGTIVAALAITQGARRQAFDEIAGLGVDNVILRSAPAADAKGRRRAPFLRLADAEAIVARIPRAIAGLRRSAANAVTLPDRQFHGDVVGVTPAWRAIAGFDMRDGRWIDAAEDASARTAVVGAVLARALFGGSDAIGQRVFAAGEWRTVVGVLAAGSKTGDRAMFVPFRSMDQSLGEGDNGEAAEEIIVKLPAGSDVSQEAAAIRALVSSTHAAAEPIDIVVPQDLLRARLRAQRSFNILLFSIGGLALLISGVGILNIMVASVSERASEIGVRRAVGARRRTVLLQFAFEAGLLGSAGGIIGVPLGIAAAFIAASLAGWPVAISVMSVIGAFALALGVGLAAGIYPAYLAAKMDPVDALRS